jgi:hypothetical protein
MTVPINMPMASVIVTSNVAITFRFRAQAANSRICMPIMFNPPCHFPVRSKKDYTTTTVHAPWNEFQTFQLATSGDGPSPRLPNLISLLN